MPDVTDAQKRAQAAIMAAFDEWAKTQSHPYPRGAFLAGAVWMANTIEGKMPKSCAYCSQPMEEGRACPARAGDGNGPCVPARSRGVDTSGEKQ